MVGKLSSTVHVDGQVYGPDDDVPADIAARITNPKAWAEPPAPVESGSDIPTKGGTGSGKEPWAAYAAAHDVEFDEDATRAEIVAALEAAGVPTE